MSDRYATPDFLVWLDLETTGLRPHTDRIMEVGLVVTSATPDLEVVDECHVLVRPVAHWPALASPEVVSMHEASGLAAEATEHGVGLGDAREAIEVWAVPWGSHLRGPLCGSSVHFDRQFLAVWMPRVLEMWSYRQIDVSSLAAAATIAGLRVPDGATLAPDAGPDHRAIPDLHRSIAVARWTIGRLGWTVGGPA